jgi:hypothetical protein
LIFLYSCGGRRHRRLAADARGTCAGVDAEQVAHWQRIRDYNARIWRAARRILNSLPVTERDRLRAEWQAAPYPASASYFADFLYQRTGRSASRELAEERSAATKEPRV